MNNRRLHLLVFTIQLLNLLLLAQTWFSVSMDLNGKTTNLGDFDAMASYALAMPVTLLAGACTLVAFLVGGLAKRLVIAFGAATTSALAVWIGVQVFERNVSGLDNQLDRLTGIAKTHGLDSLQVSVTFTPWLWLAISGLQVALGVYLTFRTATWKRQEQRPAPKQRPAKATSTIDLWEQQRD
ncbi:MAG: Trp biosynthesis-associated membrane protein [Micrococcales bacterium]